MRSVKIKTKELLEVLKENRKSHIKEFNEAWESYIVDATQQLQKMYETARDERKVIRGIDLIEPKSYEDSYNTAIRMLEMSDDKVVELTSSEFTQYVEDKWNWKESFTHITSSYKKLAEQF
jgi:chromatin segregation and condensation protein Rec8/ScpA/Scc1 (kleisin family)